jgi:hypothetical protein
MVGVLIVDLEFFERRKNNDRCDGGSLEASIVTTDEVGSLFSDYSSAC